MHVLPTYSRILAHVPMLPAADHRAAVRRLQEVTLDGCAFDQDGYEMALPEQPAPPQHSLVYPAHLHVGPDWAGQPDDISPGPLGQYQWWS